MICATVPCYNDYSSLLVLALGFNLMYVVLRKSEDRNALFFLFLHYITSPEETIKKIDSKIKIFQSIYVKLKFLQKLSVGEILKTFGNKDGKQLLNTISSSLEYNLEEKLAPIAKRITKVIDRFSNINNLQLLALLTAVYSFYVAISAPYERFFVVNFNSTLLLTNIVIIILGVLLVLLDITLSNRLRYIPKCLFVLCFLLSTCIICGVRDSWIQFDSPFVNILLYRNYWITILVCFGGFILYIVSSLIGVFISGVFHLYISAVSFFPERELQKSAKIIDAQVLNNAIITKLNPTQVLKDINMVEIKQEDNLESQ